MQLPRKHYLETKRLLKKISKDKIAQWLLEEGYFPEQYIVPPCFQVSSNPLNAEPFFKPITSGTYQRFEPTKHDLLTISFPKTQLTDRTFGIIEPKIYHDIVWYLMEEWDLVVKHLFKPENKIYSYSFPIPVNKGNVGSLGTLRGGRMIYEFLEMAENDLVAEAYNYKFILQTDIKNFYPSVYTHSIAWALHTKKTIRTKGNRDKYDDYLGLKLDKLIQYANDGCTNGVAIGPAISDLITEIVLAAVDTECSKELDISGLDFLAVRFKDDYRILCNSQEDAHKIIKCLQRHLKEYNLTLHDDKSIVSELPEGLFREWTADYQQYSLRYRKEVTYNRFEKSIRGTLKVDKKYSGTGVVDRFLSELSDKDNRLKLVFSEKNMMKAISLLLLLKERRNKSFPQILAIIEQIIEMNASKRAILRKISEAIQNLLESKFQNSKEYEYDLIWLIYFIRSNDLFRITYPTKIESSLIKSLKSNRAEFFKPIPSGIRLYDTIKKKGRNKSLLEYLALFKKG